MNKGSLNVSGLSCAILAVVIITGLLHLGARLREIQVVSAANYGYASDRQSVRRVQTAGLRGRILDRHGVMLAGNRTSVSIVCQPSAFQKRAWEETVAEVDHAIAAVAKTIERRERPSVASIRRHINESPSLPFPVWRDISERELAVFSEHELEFRGFSVEETEERFYPFGSVAAHVLGYVGRDRGNSVAGDEKFNFFAREMCGRSGLEGFYDGFLRGVPGEEKLLVDARGFATREWTVIEPQRGPDLVLSLDIRIQQIVERQLVDECGACVVMNPRNGEILAMASSPTFDLNAFVPILSHSLYEKHANDPRQPLLNRASGGAYAPGSTFKPITALAGLSLGYPETTRYFCNGLFELGQMKLHCSSRWGHGELDIRHALMKSCNPFFCNLGTEVGTNALFRAARAFGLGSKTGVDLGVDMAGVVPDAEWKQKMYRERWFVGDLIQMSIGQGMLLVSPLQMACVAGALGTGSLVVPHLKLDLVTEKKPFPFSQDQLLVVREGMRMVVDGDGHDRGTGWRAGEGVSVPVSGKTGTAEIGLGVRRRKNAWFIGYAPSDDPCVSIAMVVENGASGGGTTAPRAGEILKAIFDVR